ncbi:Crp/Fnr family transcriptional regulator [Spirosoma foliorum]|uniref:Crp/Fnr family transcriptional regulator n=1 Tax=Spirosoma foliorum TaxID=2710596 RepID=A0A7G5GPL3_9BACT|nr:Crp/Fnr family transcriptional regulator [Spirosoma foliorum]QMW00805.1 Crp/Fnr family transcriptional regulator [Spirosoma foliorum]
MLNNQSSDFGINWGAYSHLLEEITIPAKTTLLQEGDVSKNAYFIKKGCLRLWFNNNGKDVTFQFFFENYGVSSIESFQSGQPSLFSIESIEPCVLLVISKANMELIMQELPGYRELFQYHILQRMHHYAKLFLSRIKNNPQERYLELLADSPQIVQRVPQHYIASYLGITPVSLSRIRNKVLTDKK